MASYDVPKDPSAAITWLKNYKVQGSKSSNIAQIKAPPSLQSQLAVLSAPRRSESESIARFANSGVKLTIHNPESYSVEGPAAHLLFKGTGILDEHFANDPLGAVNVSKAWRYTCAGKPKFVHRFPIDDAILRQLKTIDLEAPALANALSAERIDLPIMFIMERRGGFLIDGAHRLLANVINGAPFVYGIVLGEPALAEIRVRMWMVQKDGTKREIDTTKGFGSFG